MPVYSPAPADFVQGRGVEVFTAEGKRYLDFIAGIATNSLGHCHPKLVAALTEQANKIWHMSNMYQTELQRSLAQKYTDATFADVVFFANSGTEAIEACLKLTRKYHSAKGNPERIEILGFEGAFHGRSYGAINAAANPNYLAGFGPPLPGYRQLPFGDHEALKAAIGPTTAGIILEPVQGEGGVRAVPNECLQGLRAFAIGRARMRLAAVHVQQKGQGHTPAALARDAPVGPVGDHVAQACTAVLGVEPGRVDGLERGLTQGLGGLVDGEQAVAFVHPHEPLGRRAVDHWRLVAPAVRVAVLEGGR
eukprot:gene15887-21541_t